MNIGLFLELFNGREYVDGMEVCVAKFRTSGRRRGGIEGEILPVWIIADVTYVYLIFEVGDDFPLQSFIRQVPEFPEIEGTVLVTFPLHSRI